MEYSPTHVPDVADELSVRQIYRSAIDGLTGSRLGRVEASLWLATGYVWGVEDSGKRTPELPDGCDASRVFSYLYGIQTADYVVGRMRLLAPVREAYQLWAAELAGRDKS